MKHTGDYELDTINMLEQECADLEEENKRLEEENKKLKIEIGGVMGERDGKQMRIDELEEENKKLKEELEECECSMHFENDEVGYRKRECKKLKAIIEHYKKFEEGKNKLKGILMEEDTLQELRDLGEI